MEHLLIKLLKKNGEFHVGRTPPPEKTDRTTELSDQGTDSSSTPTEDEALSFDLRLLGGS